MIKLLSPIQAAIEPELISFIDVSTKLYSALPKLNSAGIV